MYQEPGTGVFDLGFLRGCQGTECSDLLFKWKRSSVERRYAEDYRLENGSLNKKQRCVYTDRPSLLHLCMRQGALHLPQLAHKLHFLPYDLSITLLRDFLGRSPPPSFTELRILCESSWSSQNLSLSRVPRLNSRGVQQLALLPHLVQLDLRGCQWLGNLDFLSALNCLQCLNLRDCWFLRTEDLLHIRELTKLQCLDVENVSAMTDDIAAHTISELTNLRALNVSGTCVGDCLVEFLTYGSRLHSWASQQEETRVEDLKLVTETGPYGVQNLMRQYPVCNLIYLRLQRSHITNAAIAHLLELPDLLLLDVRLTNVTSRSLFSLKAKHKLIALPNNARLAARTNAMLAGVLEGECGCRAMTRHCKSSNPDKIPDEVTELWQQAFVQFLQEASKGSSC